MWKKSSIFSIYNDSKISLNSFTTIKFDTNFFHTFIQWCSVCHIQNIYFLCFILTQNFCCVHFFTNELKNRKKIKTKKKEEEETKKNAYFYLCVIKKEMDKSGKWRKISELLSLFICTSKSSKNISIISSFLTSLFSFLALLIFPSSDIELIVFLVLFEILFLIFGCVSARFCAYFHVCVWKRNEWN